MPPITGEVFSQLLLIVKLELTQSKQTQYPLVPFRQHRLRGGVSCGFGRRVADRHVSLLDQGAPDCSECQCGGSHTSGGEYIHMSILDKLLTGTDI